ncbi:MAG: NADPH-dependent FMN reductase [Chitinophagales bacterium]
MDNHPKVLAICGSTRAQSANLLLLQYLQKTAAPYFNINIFTGLDQLQHFNPDLDTDPPPAEILELRRLVEEADGIIICTPEYVFSVPGSLKNALEWFVSTTLLNDKPTALITASSSGDLAHKELKLIMDTLGARSNDDTILLIKSIKSKMSTNGEISNTELIEQLKRVVLSLNALL